MPEKENNPAPSPAAALSKSEQSLAALLPTGEADTLLGRGNEWETAGEIAIDLQNLMAEANLATVFLDRALRITRFTPSATAIFKLGLADLGLPLADLSQKFGCPELAADAEHALAHLSSAQREVRAGDRCFLARALPYRTPENQVAGVAFTFTEITAVKHAEEAMAKLAAIVESSTDAIVGKDLRGNVTSWNAGAETIYGYTAAEMIGQPLARLIPIERQDEEVRILEKIGAGESIAPFETVRIRKDGSAITVSVTISPIRDSTGKIIGGSKIARDISDAKKTEAALRESEKRHRLLAETMLQGIVHQDASGLIIAMNPAAEQILGKSREEFLGSTSTREERDTIREDGSLFRGEEHPSLVALRTGVPQRGVMMGVFNPRRKEYRWIRIDAVPVFDGDEKKPSEVYAVFEDVTEQRRQAESLQESEMRFRQIADAAPVLIWLSDKANKCTWVNKACRDFTGRTLEADRGYVWTDGIHPEDLQRCLAAYTSAFDARRPFELEYRLQHREGAYRWVLDKGVPRYNGLCEFLGYIGTCVDISVHKAAEATAQAAHRQLQTVMASITDGLAVLDRDWRYTYFSEQAARIVGIPQERLLGGCVWELFPAAEGTKFHEGYHRAMATGQKVEFEEYYPEPINKWLECHCYPSEEGLSVYFHDITARKQAEETLRQNEALFSTLIEQAPLGVYVVDAQFRMQQVNSLAQPVFSAVRPLIGRDFTEVIETLWGPEVGREIARIFRRTLETGERFVSPPFINSRVDLGVVQAFDWETQRVTLPDGQHGVVCYFIDVTERRRADAALLEAKQAAEAANQSKDRFLAVLSHELRTPLNPVLMAVSALEHDPDLPPAVREDLAMIKRNVELETKLIDDLLDLSRVTSGKVELKQESVDLNELVNQACAVCRPQLAEARVRLETKFDPSAGIITADPARLQQVFWNVLKNAVKFSASGDTVLVCTARLSPSRCEVRVTDNGIGIPPDVLPRIFNAFEQGDANVTRQFGGLGLGLAISRALVELHGGSIRAESAGPGFGATFIVELPGERVASSELALTGAPAGVTDARKIRLLLVEDHPDTARTLTRLLQAAGFIVLAATDVVSAVALAERERFDLLVSDLGLPDGDGYEVMRAVREKQPVPGIAMSGYGMEEDIRRSKLAGFTEHLVKPINIAQLIATIRRVMEHTKTPAQ